MNKITVHGIDVDVIKKKIQNLHLAVYPPDGRVRVAAPLETTEEAIRLFIATRFNWVQKKRKQFHNQSRQSEREYLTGESHYFKGKRYLLNVIDSEEKKIELRNKKHIDMYISSFSDKKKRETLMTEWYRDHLKKEIPPLLKKWQKKTGITVNEWRVRKMKTKWGTCNSEDKRIWLNLELIKKPTRTLEYILVHEMVHILEEKHTDKFKQYMDEFMPQWRQYRDELNEFILGHEEWGY